MKNRKGNGNIRNVDSMKKKPSALQLESTNVNVKKDFKEFEGFKEDKTNRNPAAKSMRYQTIASAVMVIKALKRL
jgi:hypothetical protein